MSKSFRLPQSVSQNLQFKISVKVDLPVDQSPADSGYTNLPIVRLALESFGRDSQIA